MKIRREPYRIDFLGNSPEFVLRATPWSVEGKVCSRTFTVNALPAGTLTLEIDGESLSWALSNNPGDGLWEMPAAPTGAQAMRDALESNLVYNPVVNRSLRVTPDIASGTLTLTVTFRDKGQHVVTLYHSGSPLYITPGTLVAGQDETPRPDWRAVTFYRIATSKGVHVSPEMLFEESGGDIHVPAGMVAAYMPKPDVPAWNHVFQADPCPNALAKVRLYFGEYYTAAWEKSPSLHTLSRSKEITLVNGRLEDYAAENNIPDWNTSDNTHIHLRTRASIFGQDDGDTVICPPGTEQYIYLYNYESTDIAARVIETVKLADGTVDDSWNEENITLKPGVNRVTVREDDPDVVSWKVLVCPPNTLTAMATRQFTVRDHDYGFHTFLMLNALNLYETFVVEQLAREEDTEGERRVIAGKDSYGTTDRQTVYTARCTPRNAKGLRLLRTAFAKQDNMLCEGQYAWYIDMVPGSLTDSDEGADLTECEFKFRLREKVNRNPQVISVASADFDTQTVLATDTVFK